MYLVKLLSIWLKSHTKKTLSKKKCSDVANRFKCLIGIVLEFIVCHIFLLIRPQSYYTYWRSDY